MNRKTTVQEFNKLIELLGSTGLKVLKLLGSGNTASQTAKVIGCVRSNITYWKNKLLRLDLLKLQVHDVVKIYRLTTYGSKLLTRSDKIRFPLETVVLEDHAVKFVVVEGEKRRIDWKKLGSPRNWEKLGVKIGGVRVVRTSRHVIIHPGRLKGWNTKELLFDAGRIVEKVKNVLELKFGMLVGEPAIPLHKPVFRFYSQEAKELVNHGTIMVHGPEGERLGALDESPPSREPHEEYDGEQLAAARLYSPITLMRLEKKVDSIARSMEKLAGSMQDFMEVFKKTMQPERIEIDKNKAVDYVA